MPRRIRFSIDQLTDVMISNKNVIFDEKKRKFNIPSHDCWKQVSEMLGSTISPKYLYTIALSNRYGISDKLGVTNKLKISRNVEDDIINQDQMQYLDSSLENPALCDNIIEFIITLSAQEWESIKPERPVFYKNRQFETLKIYEWTPIIHEHFFIQTKLSCPVAYKRASIFPTGSVYLKIYGKCSSCQSSFEGTVENVPDSGTRVAVQCTYFGDFENCKSAKKRRIIGQKRDYYITKMVSEKQSATYVRRMEANRMMNYGNAEPSSLPTLNALRLIKHKKSKDGQLHEDPILALAAMKDNLPYSQIIRDIGYDRFFIHYWSVSEINTYRLYCKSVKYPKISLDASGGLVRKINLISGRKTKEIFLYEIVVNFQEQKCQFSVGHMLSERHDNNSISYWLTEWLKNGIPSPKIVVCDHSLALMMAIVKTFTQFSTLQKYLEACSQCLLNDDESQPELPHCMLRNDFNHTMRIVSSWPELKSATYRIKNFYLRSIGLLIVCTDWHDIKTIITCIFTVALNEEDGTNESNVPTPCEISKTYLKNRIAFHSAEALPTFENDYLETVKSNEDILSEELSETRIYIEIKLIYDCCLEKSKDSPGNHDNMQFNPQIAKKLLEFTKKIACWSAIMTPIFGYSELTESSAGCESTFNNLKNRVFNHQTLPVRLDRFFEIHMNSILGSMNITQAHLRKLENETDEESREVDNGKIDKMDVIPETKSIEEVDVVLENTQIENKNTSRINEGFSPEDEEENWRGLIVKKCERPKDNYTKADPTVLHYNDNSRTKSSVIGLLRNGNVCALKSIKIAGANYTFTNTCAFDSIVQMFCTAYADSFVYSNFIRKNRDYIFYELVSNMTRDGVCAQTYRKRANVLLKIFGNQLKELQSTHFSADVATTAYYLLNELLCNFPSYQEIRVCSSCQSNHQRSVSTITLNLPEKNLTFFQHALTELFQTSLNKKCQSCDSSTLSSFKLNEHLFIEICPPFKRNTNYQVPVYLDDVPKTITLLEKDYTLRGVLRFIESAYKEESAVGHYVAYCYRNHSNLWQKFDDLSIKSSYVGKRTFINNCQFLMYSL